MHVGWENVHLAGFLLWEKGGGVMMNEMKIRRAGKREMGEER